MSKSTWGIIVSVIFGIVSAVLDIPDPIKVPVQIVAVAALIFACVMWLISKPKPEPVDLEFGMTPLQRRHEIDCAIAKGEHVLSDVTLDMPDWPKKMFRWKRELCELPLHTWEFEELNEPLDSPAGSPRDKDAFNVKTVLERLGKLRGRIQG